MFLESLRAENPVFKSRYLPALPCRTGMKWLPRMVLLLCDGRYTVEEMVITLGGNTPGSRVTYDAVANVLFTFYWDRLIEWIPTDENHQAPPWVQRHGGASHGEPTPGHLDAANCEPQPYNGFRPCQPRSVSSPPERHLAYT